MTDEDKFCGFMAKHVMPHAADSHGDENLIEHVVAHMAIVGAVDALLAWRDAQNDT